MKENEEQEEEEEEEATESKWAQNFYRDLMAGAILGGVVHTIVAPIERAKLLLQTQESNLAIVGGQRGNKNRRFKGMLDCIVRTVREEGVVSLWRGNGSSVLRYYPSVALNFSLKVRRPLVEVLVAGRHSCVRQTQPCHLGVEPTLVNSFVFSEGNNL